MPKFDVTDFLMQDYTPLNKNLWKFTFPNLVGNIKIPSFLCKTASRPKWAFEETEIDYMTQKRYVAGKLTYEPMEVALMEPIDTTLTQAILAWSNLIQEVSTGVRGYTSMYKKDCILELLDGLENVVQKWTLRGSWPANTNLGDLDYSTGEPIEATISIRFDKPLLDF